MAIRLVALLLAAVVSLGVSATDRYAAELDVQEFTTVTGFFTVPKLPISDGGSFIGPGLRASNGVLQVVIDSRYNQLWAGPEFRGTPAIPWGPGFNISQGEDMTFLFNKTETGWIAEVGWAPGGGAHGFFDIRDSVLNTAAFTAELNDLPFNFGPIEYRDIKLTATTPASEWCDKIRKVGDYSLTISDPVASGNTCTIASITQNGA